MPRHGAQVERRGRPVTGAALVHGHAAGEPLRRGRRLVQVATGVGELRRLAAEILLIVFCRRTVHRSLSKLQGVERTHIRYGIRFRYRGCVVDYTCELVSIPANDC